MKNIYLIDYENVGKQGLAGLEGLTKNDWVILFYSQNADSVSFDLFHKLTSCAAKLDYYKADVGTKNALDFQLTTYLGYLIAKNPEASFYVVTKDTGYKVLLNFWAKHATEVTIVADLSSRTNIIKQEAEMETKIRQLFPDKKEADKIIKIVKSLKTKNGINNALVKQFPSDKNKKASEIYAKIKPLLANKK